MLQKNNLIIKTNTKNKHVFRLLQNTKSKNIVFKNPILYDAYLYKINMHTSSQSYAVFVKRRFGLFKAKNSQDKLIKKQLIFLSNFIKNKPNVHTYKDLGFIKKTKIIFYKKLHKLFFRSGRALFISYFKTKKTKIQTFISKRITSVIKNNWTSKIESNDVISLVLNSNVFYSYKDANNFIKNFGVIIDKKIIYHSHFKINKFTKFSFFFHKNILTFFNKKRQHIIYSLKNIKFYKFRSKLFQKRFKSMWVPSLDWITEHCFLYLTKNSNVEFDFRTLTGVLIYERKFTQFNTFMINYNVSLFMTRSYNWKYIV